MSSAASAMMGDKTCAEVQCRRGGARVDHFNTTNTRERAMSTMLLTKKSVTSTSDSALRHVGEQHRTSGAQHRHSLASSDMARVSRFCIHGTSNVVESMQSTHPQPHVCVKPPTMWKKIYFWMDRRRATQPST